MHDQDVMNIQGGLRRTMIKGAQVPCGKPQRQPHTEKKEQIGKKTMIVGVQGSPVSKYPCE